MQRENAQGGGGGVRAQHAHYAKYAPAVLPPPTFGIFLAYILARFYPLSWQAVVAKNKLHPWHCLGSTFPTGCYWSMFGNRPAHWASGNSWNVKHFQLLESVTIHRSQENLTPFWTGIVVRSGLVTGIGLYGFQFPMNFHRALSAHFFVWFARVKYRLPVKGLFYLMWGPVVQWLVQRFQSERLRVRSRRSATFTPSALVRRQYLPVWPPTLNKTPLPLHLPKHRCFVFENSLRNDIVMAILSRVSQERCGFALSALLASSLGSWGARETWQAQLGVQHSFWRRSTHRPPRLCSDLWKFDFPQATIYVHSVLL